MSGYEIVQQSSDFHVLAAPQVNTGYASVSCPAGKVVISGGYSISGAQAGSVIVTASYPDSGKGGWSVNFQNTGQDTAMFTTEVYAVCVFVE